MEELNFVISSTPTEKNYNFTIDKDDLENVGNDLVNSSAPRERLTPENVRRVVYFGGALMALGTLLMGGALLFIFSPQAVQFVNTAIQKLGAQPVNYNNLVIGIAGVGIAFATTGFIIAGSICSAAGLVCGKSKIYKPKRGVGHGESPLHEERIAKPMGDECELEGLGSSRINEYIQQTAKRAKSIHKKFPKGTSSDLAMVLNKSHFNGEIGNERGFKEKLIVEGILNDINHALDALEACKGDVKRSEDYQKFKKMSEKEQYNEIMEKRKLISFKATIPIQQLELKWNGPREKRFPEKYKKLIRNNPTMLRKKKKYRMSLEAQYYELLGCVTEIAIVGGGRVLLKLCN